MKVIDLNRSMFWLLLNLLLASVLLKFSPTPISAIPNTIVAISYFFTTDRSKRSQEIEEELKKLDEK